MRSISSIWKAQARSSAIGVTGLNVSKRYGYATVVSVIPGSPADKEQIEDGDIIESIEGQSTREMSVALVRLLLEGAPGTNVTFSAGAAAQGGAGQGDSDAGEAGG